MATLVLELNDAGLMLARRSDETSVEVLACSPGFALLERDQVLTGESAYARWRLRPRFAHNRYFADLNTESLPHSAVQVQTTADLAFVHLSELLSPHLPGSADMLLAVPGGFTREQLGLLLGILHECGVRVVGVADAALTASMQPQMPGRSAHLELQLHRSVLSVLEHDRHGAVARMHYEIEPRTGVMPLQQASLQYIADVFVRKTRFDPMYEAQHEQALVDKLPALLMELQAETKIECTIEARSSRHTVELTRPGLLQALERHYADLEQLLRGALRAHESLPVAISQRLSQWPGLVQRLSETAPVQVRMLAADAAVRGVLQYENSIRRTADTLSLITRLPADIAEEDAAASVLVPAAVPMEQQPTHVLHAGRAYGITRQPLTLGCSVPPERRVLQVPAAPGVSRSHCTLLRRNGAVLIEDHSTYGTFVNDARVQGVGALKVGDRLRLGTPGVTLELIQLVDDDGTRASQV